MTTHETSSSARPIRQALLRGWARKCPNCGSGPLMRGYLTVRESCEVCGQELFHHRADDGPAWLTIILSGHILAPLMLLVYEIFRPEPLVMSAGFAVVFVALALYLLPRLKGGIVAYQWANRMHGFGGTDVTAPAE